MKESESVRPGFSNQVLVLDKDLNPVSSEVSHLHAKMFAEENGYEMIEDCQPERKRQRRDANGVWKRAE